MTETTLHFLVPHGIDDESRVSGGNVYDRRLAEGLGAGGTAVRMLPVRVGDGPDAARALAALPRDALVLVDGLVAVGAPAVFDEESIRLRIVVLAHMVASVLDPSRHGPTAEHERHALAAGRRVIATSEWTRSELVARGLAEAHRITVARPGTDAAPAATGSATGGRLLCVGAVAPHKGQDVLAGALAGLADLPGWTCSIVGSLDVDPAFGGSTAEAVRSAGLADRVRLTGVVAGRRLADAYDTADLVVVVSRAESYGMVVAEALARGIPVIASAAGGIPEATAGSAAVTLVAPGDPDALRTALRLWLTDPAHRTAQKAVAVRSRSVRRTWEETAATVAAVLGDVDAPVAALGDRGRTTA